MGLFWSDLHTLLNEGLEGDTKEVLPITQQPAVSDWRSEFYISPDLSYPRYYF